jgi:hypothetical protein
MAVATAVAFATAIGACASAESLSGGVLRKDGLTVHLGPVPPGWQALELDGADVAYRDSARAASALFEVRCGRRDDDAPLSVLTEHLIMGTSERRITLEELVPLDRREALHTRMSAKLDGVPMAYDIYVMKKDGCVYDLVYVAPPERYTEGEADFERFARGLRAISPSVPTGVPTGDAKRDPSGPLAPTSGVARRYAQDAGTPERDP